MRKGIKGFVTVAFFLLLWVSPLAADLRLENESVSSTVAFEWDPVEGADRYVVWVGSVVGGHVLGRQSSSSTRLVIDGIPTDNSDLIATMRARVNGRWQIESSLVFSALQAPLIYSPFKNHEDELPTLSGSAARFAWGNALDGESITTWLLMAGTLNDPDAYARRRAVGGDRYVSLSNLPVDGTSVWVTLMWRDHLNRWRTEQAVEFQASSTPSITYPVSGDQLTGSAEIFRVQMISGAEDSRLRIGTAIEPNKYGVWYKRFEVVGLPLDGSGIVVLHDFYDGRRWVNASKISYLAGFSGDYLWGDCTPVQTGLRLRGSASYPFDEFWKEPTRGTVMGLGVDSFDSRLFRHLTDGCASDTDYVTTESLDYYRDAGEKGLLLWLAPGSGAAKVRYINNVWGRGPLSILRAIHPTDGIAQPVYFPLNTATGDGSDEFYFSIQALDPDKPVKISEIRAVTNSWPVGPYRKLRFNQNIPYFVAMSGDARARVTASIAEQFGGYYNAGEGSGPNPDTCGGFHWIDATWMTDQGITVDGYYHDGVLRGGTVWVNWERVTNAEIVSAISDSIQAGIASNWYYYTCTPALLSSYDIDWLGEAQSALTGSYSGPVLVYE